MSGLINREQIKSALIETLTVVLKNSLPYNTSVEFDAVLGVRLDGINEFFVSLREQIKRAPAPPQLPIVVTPNAVKSPPPIQRMVNPAEISNLPIGSKIVVTGNSIDNLISALKSQGTEIQVQNSVSFDSPEEEATLAVKCDISDGEYQELSHSPQSITISPNENEPCSSTVDMPVISDHQSQDIAPNEIQYIHQTTTEATSSSSTVVQDYNMTAVEAAEQLLSNIQPVTVSNITILPTTSTDSETDLEKTNVSMYQNMSVRLPNTCHENVPVTICNTINDVPTSSSTLHPELNVTEQLTKSMGKKICSRIYKVPKEHLDNPPCTCCQVLQRYRDKDKNVRKRQKIYEETGSVPPRAPMSKIYKLPKNHVTQCSCCEVLASKREYWKQLTQRRRTKDKHGHTEPHWINISGNVDVSEIQ